MPSYRILRGGPIELGEGPILFLLPGRDLGTAPANARNTALVAGGLIVVDDPLAPLEPRPPVSVHVSVVADAFPEATDQPVTTDGAGGFKLSPPSVGVGGSARVSAGPAQPASPAGEYVWLKTNGAGVLLDIVSGVI